MTTTMTPIDRTPACIRARILAGTVLALALSLALPLAAQETQETSQGSQEASQEAQDAERVTAEDIQAEFDEAFETIRSYSEEQRDEAVAAMRETLSEIDTEIAGSNSAPARTGPRCPKPPKSRHARRWTRCASAGTS